MKEHAEFCEAEAGHAHDCTTATGLARVARIVAFAETVRNITACGYPATAVEEADHTTVCLHHAALDCDLQALARFMGLARGSRAPVAVEVPNA